MIDLIFDFLKMCFLQAEGEVEPTCDAAEGGGKEQDCDSHSSNSLHEEMSKTGQNEHQYNEDMASVHEKDQKSKASVLGRNSKSGSTKEKSVADLYVASMLLSGVGDAMGYYKGRWEFNTDGLRIHKELKDMGGLGSLHLTSESCFIMFSSFICLVSLLEDAWHHW